MRCVVLFTVFLVAGCLDAKSDPPLPPGEPDIREPLPEPRSNNPSNNVGLLATNDTTGQVPNSAWASECVRHWRSGGYTFSEPPVIAQRICSFLPTEAGTAFWHVVPFAGEARDGVPAAPIPRDDGFYDWVVFKQYKHGEPGGRLQFFENGSLAPSADWGDIAADAREGVSAARWSDGTVHALIAGHEDVSEAGPRRWVLHHAWWKPGADPMSEIVPSGSFFAEPTLRLGEHGIHTVGSPTGGPGGPGTVYTATDGAFRQRPPLAGPVWDVVEHDDALHACMSLPAGYWYARLDLDTETPLVWEYELIVDDALSMLSFSCDIAIDHGRPVVVVDSPALIGGGPNPLAGSIAFTREAGAWNPKPIGTTYWSGDDLFTADQTPVHIGTTGSGTSNGEPKCGFGVRRPDSQGEWTLVACNFADWAYGIDTADRTQIVTSGLFNPPFETWKCAFEDAPNRFTALVWVLPPHQD